MGLFPEEYREQVQNDSKSGMQYAADKLQWSIVKGLDQIDGVDVKIANSLYVGSYPKRYKKLIIPTFVFKHSQKASNDINIGFCNLSGYKFISRYFSVKKVLKKWAKEQGDEQKVLLVYALTTPFCQLAGYIKRKFSNIKVCIVVPDLPEFMHTSTLNKKSIYGRLKSIEISMIKKAIKHIDCYVLLTDAMKEWFDKPVKYTVVEGISSGTSALDNDMPRTKTILYAGGIKREYGVVDLVESFIKVNRSDWELIIYGSGTAVEEIKEITKEHNNVILMGMAPNDEVVAKQLTSSVLVNPRKNHVFTKYSFPSKVLEYMSSGTPMLAYKLDGIPDEYDEFYYHIPETENGFEEALRHVMSLAEQERSEMGMRAKQFVLENKNPKCQANKIVELINSISQ